MTKEITARLAYLKEKLRLGDVVFMREYVEFLIDQLEQALKDNAELVAALEEIAQSVPNQEITESLRSIAWAHWMRDEAIEALTKHRASQAGKDEER